MPKLLNFLKENEITHEEVILHLTELMKNKPKDKTDKPDSETEEVEEPETKDEQTIKPDPETDKSSESEEEESEEEEVLDKTKEDKAKITELVQKEVIKQLKIKRKTPSKGKLVNSPPIEYGISNRGYEELV